MQDQVAGALRQGLTTLDAIDSDVKAALLGITPEVLADGFRVVLEDLLHDVLADNTGLLRRQVQIKVIYLLERFSEMLQDLIAMEKITKGSDLMAKIERAHRFAAKIALVKDSAGRKDLLADYDQLVKPISFLDPIPAADKERRREDVRKAFTDFITTKG